MTPRESLFVVASLEGLGPLKGWLKKRVYHGFRASGRDRTGCQLLGMYVRGPDGTKSGAGLVVIRDDSLIEPVSRVLYEKRQIRRAKETVT